MGGPSKKEIRSDETLTEYVDGELTDELLLQFFELELSEDPKLQYRLQNMVAIKSQIASIFGTNQMRATEFVENEIRKIVKNAQIPEAQSDHDDEIEVTDAELLISSLIDGELAEPELSMVEKLITDNETYRELYEQLVTSKIKISDTLLNENLGPNANVKMQISSLVAELELEKPDKARGQRNRMSSEMMSSKTSSRELANKNFQEAGEQGADEDAEFKAAADQGDEQLEQLIAKKDAELIADVFGSKAAYSPSEQIQNASKPEKKRLASSLNYYAQRLVPLAAVFVVGLYISPTLFSSGAINPNEYYSKLRGGGISAQSNKSFDFIEIVQSQNAENQTFVHFNLTAPIAGFMSISLATSSQNEVSSIPIGETSESIGQVEVGQSVRYPAEQDFCVDPIDKLLKIDVNIYGEDKTVSLTEFVTINDEPGRLDCTD